MPRYFSESRYSARYVPANIPWPMTLPTCHKYFCLSGCPNPLSVSRITLSSTAALQLFLHSTTLDTTSTWDLHITKKWTRLQTPRNCVTLWAMKSERRGSSFTSSWGDVIEPSVQALTSPLIVAIVVRCAVHGIFSLIVILLSSSLIVACSCSWPHLCCCCWCNAAICCHDDGWPPTLLFPFLSWCNGYMLLMNQ